VSRAFEAIRRKLNVMRGLGALWPAVKRGGKLLLRGRFREFARKLFSERTNSKAIPARTGPKLFLAGHVMGNGGYDQVVLNILEGLLASGVNVCRDTGATFRPELVPLVSQPTEARRTDEPRLTIIPPHLLHRFPPDDRTAVLTMWETDTLPSEAVRLLNRAALVIAPSDWGAKCFRRNGVTVPIEVVPLGYDPEVFHVVSRRRARQPPSAPPAHSMKAACARTCRE
jgi:glycosyltransferase involved in cell wall biosynthesis